MMSVDGQLTIDGFDYRMPSVAESAYRVGIAGKLDVFPAKCFPFEDVPGFDSNCVRKPTKRPLGVG